MGIGERGVASAYNRAGATLRGPRSGRSPDVLSVGLHGEHFTHETGAGLIDDVDASCELLCRIRFTSAGILQPHDQYITDAGWTGLANALNLGVRFQPRFLTVIEKEPTHSLLDAQSDRGRCDTVLGPWAGRKRTDPQRRTGCVLGGAGHGPDSV